MQIFSTWGTSTCSRRMMVCNGSLVFHEATQSCVGTQLSAFEASPLSVLPPALLYALLSLDLETDLCGATGRCVRAGCAAAEASVADPADSEDSWRSAASAARLCAASAVLPDFIPAISGTPFGVCTVRNIILANT